MSNKDTVQKDFVRCGNPMCGNIIWNYQYKYGTGKYCDAQCSSDARISVIRTNQNALGNKSRWTVQTVFPHKTLPVQLIIK